MRDWARLRRWLSVAVLTGGTVSLALAQRHGHKRAERVEILQLEQQWRQAELSENVPAAEHMLSDDFLGITAAGQVVTKQQELDRMRSRQLDLTRLDISDSKVRISGNLAIVVSLAHLEGTDEGHSLRGNFRYTRIYQHTPGDGWKITNFEATPVPGGFGSYGPSLSSRGASAAKSPLAAPSSAAASPGALGSPQPQS
jgi:ketosteroid isomerase-like protein